MGKIYALLVGIDRYQNVRPLSGCVADIKAIRTLLEARIPRQDLHLSMILDADASRAGIIGAFRRHLGRARSGDLALFYYCGHGSLEWCPPEWERLEPGGMNQTLVPYDARAPGVFDIADKELNALIGEVASPGVTVIGVFDSCHSGGVTRERLGEPEDPAVRMTAAATAVQRTLDDYLEAARELYDPERIATSGPPEPRHIAIAACQPDQTAKELPMNGMTRGVFSVAFAEAVTALGPSATYADLVTAVRARVRDRAERQVPCLYVAGGATAHEVFLAGRIGRRDLTVDWEAGSWWLSAGAIDGVRGPAEHVVTEVTVHEHDAELGASVPPLAHAYVVEVAADRARLALRLSGAELDSARQYRGVVARLDRPALEVVTKPTSGDATGIGQVRAELEGHPLFTLVDAAGTGPAVLLEVGPKESRLLSTDGRDLPGLAFPLNEEGLQALTGACVHLARWHSLRERTSADSTINDGVSVELMPLAVGETNAPADRRPLEPVDGSVALRYAGGQPPRVQVRLRNRLGKRVYAALVDLTDAYGCVPLFADWLEPEGLGWVFGGRAQKLVIPDWKPASAPEVTDFLKVVAATSDFDVERWRQEPLLGVRDRGALANTLRSGRTFAEDTETARVARDDSLWGTTRLTVRTTRE